MNPCNQLKTLFSDYIENALDAAQAESVKSHLNRCPECRDTVSRLKGLKSVMRKLNPIRVSPDFGTILRTRIRIETSMERKSVLGNIFGGTTRVPAYVASFAIVILVVFLIRSQLDRNNGSNNAAAISTFTTVNGQVLAPTDSEYTSFNIEDQIHYEMGQMYLSATTSESLKYQNKTGKDSDSLIFRQDDKSRTDLKRRQHIRQVSF